MDGLFRRHIYFKHTSLRCEECDKTFTKNVYKKHMETVHADKTNRCEISGFSHQLELF